MDLLESYKRGIAKVTSENYEAVMERSGGRCEICGGIGQEVHHLAGRRRKVWEGNLIMLCVHCHKPPNGIHGNSELYETQMKKLQDRYFDMGYSEDEVRYLLGTKSGRLF